MTIMNIWLSNQDNYLSLNYHSKYSSGSIPVDSPIKLVKAIEEVCGKGSYSFYFKHKEFPFGYTKNVISHDDYSKYTHLPRLTYWQQGVKTEVIETCREVARKVWGNIPEMQVGWLENMCKTYVDA